MVAPTGTSTNPESARVAIVSSLVRKGCDQLSWFRQGHLLIMNGLRSSIVQYVVSTTHLLQQPHRFYSRRSCPSCGKQIIVAHLLKTRYKMEPQIHFFINPLSAPSCSAVNGTHNILLSSKITKNYPIPSHRLTRHVFHRYF